MANINETPLDRYLRKTGKIGDGNLYSKLSTTPIKKPTNKGGLLGGIGYTFEQLGLGVVRGVEGLSDFLVGGVADIFGADDFADEIMKSDWINYEHANEWYNPNKAMSVVGDIGQGVGAMLPSIGAAAAITYFSGGTAAPVAAKIVGGTMLGTQAAGQATSQATKESGTAGGKEWLYGIGSGIAEAAVEGISGGIGGKAAGTLLGKQVAKSTAGKLAMSAVGEGLEEVAGDYIDVGLRRATGVEKDAKLPTAKELGKTFIVGAGVGGVLGGAGRATNAIKAGGFNNLNASENAQELTDRLTENNLRQAKGKTARYTPKDMQDTARRLSNNLQKMDAQKRKAYMDSNPFMKAYFSEDGTLLSDVGVSSGTEVNGGLSTYSASLRGREDTLAYAPSQNATETSQRAMDTVTKLTGGKAEVVLTDHDFGVTKNGKKINGEYRNGVIYLSATATDADKVNFVAHHEMAHTLEGTKEYGVLGDYIAEMIAKNPTKYAQYNLDAYKERYSQSQTEELSAETKEYEAITEIYADFIANEILSSQESVNRLANRDANIVKKFLSWVKTAIKNIGMSKEERVAYKELRRMEKLLANALDAGKGGVTLAEIEKGQRARKEAMEGVEQKTTGELATARASLSSISQSFFGEQVSLKDFERRKYKETKGYKQYVEECVSNIIQSRENLNETEARKEIEASIDGIVDVAVAMKKAGYDILDVGDERNARDSKNRLLFSSLEPNSDYFTSHDISTICDKRKNFAAIYDEIVRREEAMNVPRGKRFFDKIDNYFVLHDILAEHGLTAACRQCYVESMRKNLAPMANAFIDLMQEKNANNKSNRQLFNNKGEVKKGNTELRENLLAKIAESEYDITADDLTVEMLTTAEGLVQLKLQAPFIYEAFNSFYGQAKPKMPKTAVPFRFGELTALLKNHNGTINQTLVKQINSTGGFRLQSYSDFQIENWTDVLQVLFEAGTLGLNGHAYTKVPAFLDATEGTNLKRNVSVFMYKDNEIKGVNKWRIDKRDSFPAELEDIFAIVEADESGNTGIIAVSQNDDMSAWIMANKMIAYGIPFHKSGMKMDTVRETVVKEGGREIKGYLGTKDHTRQQNEVYKKTEGDHKAFTRVKKGINIYEFWDFANTENLSQNKLIEKNVKRYIDECEKAGYYPKFRDYVMDNDGIINKIVAYSKALGDANATVDYVSFEYKGYRIPYGYYKFLGDFGMFKPNGKASPQEILSLKDYDFKKAVSFFKDAEQLRRNEILQQFDNASVREEYRNSDLTTEQLQDILNQKRGEVVEEVLSKKKAESRKSLDDEGEKVAGIRRVTEEKEPQSLQERWQTVKQRTAEGNIASQIAFTNVQAGIEAAGERLGVDLKGKVQKARGATAAALNMIVNEQRDYTGKNNVGKSIKDIFDPIFSKGDDYTVDFYEYLLHKHNVDRMDLERKAILELSNLLKTDEETIQQDIDNLLKENKKLKNTAKDELKKTKQGKQYLKLLNQKRTIKSLIKKNTSDNRQTVNSNLRKNMRSLKNGKLYLSLLQVTNKPVFNESVTAKESLSRINELQVKHPEFVEKSKEVWNYNHNLLQRRVDAGLITQEMADDLNKKYPHYVPTFRDVEGLPKQGKAGTKNTKYSVEVKKTIKTATGSNLDILDISVMMSNQTQAVLRAEAINDLAGALYDAAVAKSDFTDVGVISEKDLDEVRDESEDGDIDYAKSVPKNNEVIFFRDGKQITMAVSQPVFIGFESFNGTAPYSNPLVRVLEKINELFKKGVTTWNPLFLIRNAVRDFQEAIFYTKNGMGKFIANLPKAIKIMSQKGDLWQQYLAIGGYQSGYFNNETGIYDPRGKVRKGLVKVGDKLSFLNEFIEQIPRFNEFMLSLESGKSIEDALLDSADVTTNFSRGGRVTKVLNRTLMPFLNPSVQGFSKLWRTITGRKTARQWGAFVVKALAFGLSVGLINDLLNGDDEDYKNLNTRDKENYFVLGIGDGKFIKIPKGRVVAAFGSIASRTKALLEGDEKAFEGWGSSVAQMVTPADQVTRTIFSPFTDAKTNTTWYGTNIESQSLQNYAIKDRYDEGTSSIAIWIGQTLNISPKKVHYVIDQYSGVIGDVILPATTKKAERDMFSSAFTIDGVTSNRISTDFYDMKDEMMYAKNNGDLIADLVYSYLNRVSSEASEMYKEKREIQGGKLSDKEKLEQAKVVQATINATLQGAMLNAEKLEQILIDMNYEETVISLTKNKTYLNMDEETKTKTAKALKDYTYAKALSELTGEKCEKKYYLFDSIGANATAVYLTEISKIESDKDKDGKTIANSRKEKVHKYIEHLKLSKEQKYILMYLAGYTPTEEGKKYVENYLRKNSFTDKELENLWE